MRYFIILFLLTASCSQGGGLSSGVPSSTSNTTNNTNTNTTPSGTVTGVLTNSNGVVTGIEADGTDLSNVSGGETLTFNSGNTQGQTATVQSVTGSTITFTAPMTSTSQPAVGDQFSISNSTNNQTGHGEDLKYSNGHPLKCWDTRSEITNPENEVVTLVNNYRISLGLNALTHDEGLRKCIRAHCHHMFVHNFFSHDNPEGDDPWKRAAANGISADGENIAKGYTTATSVFNGWKASAGHDANMRGSHTKIGVGYYNEGYHWGQLFK